MGAYFEQKHKKGTSWIKISSTAKVILKVSSSTMDIFSKLQIFWMFLKYTFYSKILLKLDNIFHFFERGENFRTICENFVISKKVSMVDDQILVLGFLA